MTVIQKKVCILGAFAVGKTSLVGRFVKNEFSEKYLTTVGVKMDTKAVTLNSELGVKLIIWDIAGENGLKKIFQTYLRGSAGFLMVIDGTRASTLEAAIDMKEGVKELLGDIPFVILVNKVDLKEQWEITDEHLARLNAKPEQIFFTSAKSGDQVEDAFATLSRYMAL